MRPSSDSVQQSNGLRSSRRHLQPEDDVTKVAGSPDPSAGAGGALCAGGTKHAPSRFPWYGGLYTGRCGRFRRQEPLDGETWLPTESLSSLGVFRRHERALVGVPRRAVPSNGWTLCRDRHSVDFMQDRPGSALSVLRWTSYRSLRSRLSTGLMTPGGLRAAQQSPRWTSCGSRSPTGVLRTGPGELRAG
jgi:hypothetical protein